MGYGPMTVYSTHALTRHAAPARIQGGGCTLCMPVPQLLPPLCGNPRGRACVHAKTWRLLASG